MSIKILKNFSDGLVNTYSPVNIRDDQFAKMLNLFSWHRSIYPKVGNTLLAVATTISTISTFSLDSSGNGSTNILAGLPSTAYVTSAQVLLSDGVNSYSQSSALDGTLTTSGSATGTINYATGAITLSGGNPSGTVSGTVSIAYGLPIMGILTWTYGISQSQQVILDTVKAYSYNGNNIPPLSDNSLFNSSGNPCSWNGQDYNQFNGANFAESLWITNSVAGMQFKTIQAVSLGSTTNIQINSHGLVAGDAIWVNECSGSSWINGLTLTVSSVPDANHVVVAYNSTGEAAYTSGGIAQYLTSNAAYPNRDGLRYYYGNGFVNYAPPINPFVEGGLPVEYICGCTSMLAFKSRLLLFGVVVGTAAQIAAGSFRTLSSTFAYSSIYGINFGSPYYAELNPISTVNSGAFYAYPAGQYGGTVDFGNSQTILGAIEWKLDYVFVTFPNSQYRIYSTPSAITPFAYTKISSQYGGVNASSSVSFDKGVFGLSLSGMVVATGDSVTRFDDDVRNLYQSVSLANNGISRACAYRNTQLELLYFTFPNAKNSNIFPDTSIVYNFFDSTWAIFEEAYTSYGLLTSLSLALDSQQWQKSTKPWSAYTAAWNAFDMGSSDSFLSAGNHRGFLFRIGVQDGYGNDPSLPIGNIAGDQVTIASHNLVEGQYVYIDGCIGSTEANGKIWQISSVPSPDILQIDGLAATGTYLGLGVAAIVDNFFLQTKDFSSGLGSGLGTKIGSVWLQVQKTSAGMGAFSLLALPSTSSIPSNIPSETFDYVPIFEPNMSSSPDDDDGYNLAQIDQQYVWKKCVVNAVGSSVSLAITRSNSQMTDINNKNAPLIINSIVLEESPSSRIVN